MGSQADAATDDLSTRASGPRRSRAWRGALAALLTSAGASSAAAGVAPPAGDLAFFETQVRPVLEKRCLGCHSHAAKKAKGGLVLDSRAGWERGGSSGPAIVPGDPGRSLVIKAVRRAEPDLEMPPDEPLPPGEVAVLESWVARGAPDPRAGGAAAAAADVEAGRAFWAFRPIEEAAAPEVRDRAWPRGEIDRLVLHELEARGLAPAADAPDHVLVRRLHYDLIGLPPSPAEAAAFARDRAPGRLERLVDRLLASPHFGERWGRHWLDVARFSQSSGGGRPFLYPEAWRYRDFVIQSFNDDKPFDRFVREQIAGDLLPAETRPARWQNLVATSFLALGPTNFERQDKEALRMDVVDEQLDTIGKALIGLTIGCARCHDHKFDPIPIRDYYALAGILRSTKTLVHDNVSKWIERPLPLEDEEERAVAAHEADVKALEGRLEEARRAVKAAEKAADKAARAAAREAAARLEAEVKALREAGPARPMTMSVEEEATPADSPIFLRGDVKNPGPDVRRGFLSVLARGPAPPVAAGQSGRRELADWLVAAENPLTARVLANRVWHWLFGAGLVRTVDNFGATGEPPSHPALLDHLAHRLRAGGWSLKRLIRAIVLSRAYGLGAAAPAALVAADPDNRLWGRAHRRPLDAEALRDTMLDVAGRLDRTVYGPNLAAGTKSEIGYKFTDVRRSVYTPVFRYELHDLFEAFDFADPNLVQGRRPRTTTAAQALFLRNSPFVAEQAAAAAARLLEGPARSDEARAAEAFRRALGRPPTPRERALVLALVGADTARAPARGARRVEAWARVYKALFACLDFRFL